MKIEIAIIDDGTDKVTSAIEWQPHLYIEDHKDELMNEAYNALVRLNRILVNKLNNTSNGGTK